MPGTLVPNVPAPYPATLTVPLNTEPLDATQEQVLDQALLDGVEGARLQLYGGGIRRRVSCTSDTVMVIQPLGGFAVTTGGLWKVLTHSVVSTVNPTTMTGGLAASTRYWVYVYNSAGSAAFTASVTGPAADLRYMSGNTDLLYVSTFYTDAAGSVLVYTQADFEYEYDLLTTPGAGLSGNLSLDDNSTSGTITTVWGPSVPAASKAVHYAYRFIGGAGEVGRIEPTGKIFGGSGFADGTGRQWLGNGVLSYNAGGTFDTFLFAGTGVNTVWAKGFRL